MDRLVDHLFVFEGDGEIRDFPGNYTSYREWLKVNEKKGDKWGELGKMKGSGVSTQDVSVGNTSKQKDKSLAQEKKKPSFNEKREYETLEKEIAALETEKKTLEDSISSMAFEDIQKASTRIGEIAALISDKESRWLELSELM
jgi:ATP-binding cassette subfamily F protein uup